MLFTAIRVSVLAILFVIVITYVMPELQAELTEYITNIYP